jgi:hypothetical protein
MQVKSVALVAAAAAALFFAGTLAPMPSIGAQEDGGATPAATAEEPRERFLQRVADKLGVEVSALEEAIKDARLEMVEEALAAGRINEDQAAKARERIENGEGAGLRRLREWRRERHERTAPLRGLIVESAATAIGITPDDLREELRSGKSIADVAADNGASLDDVKTEVLAAAEAKLAEAVANGRIDQAKSDALLQRFTDNLDAILSKHRTEPAPVQ